MANFKAGDVVVCLTAQGTYGVTAGDQYKVRAVDKASCCGHSIVDIGDTSRTGRTQCSYCKRIYPGSWYLAWRFIKLDGLKDETLSTEKLEA